MAEKTENTEKEKEGEAKPARSPKMLIIIVAAVVLAGAGGYFAMSKSGNKGVAAEEGKSSGSGEAGEGHGNNKEGDKHNAGHVHPLDSFIVNLSDPNRTRYLKVTIQLELDKPEAIEEVKSKTPQVRDALIILLSSKSMEDISSPAGKYQLRDEIIARVKQFVTKGTIATAYFTDFVVQ